MESIGYLARYVKRPRAGEFECTLSADGHSAHLAGFRGALRASA